MPLKQKVTFQQEAGFHASAFAKTEGKLRNYRRWAIAKLKAERSIGQDFEEMGLQRGGSKARGAPLKKALDQLRISKKTSQRWRKVARIPTPWFDRYLKQGETDAAALSTDAILSTWEAEQPGHLNIAGARGPGEGYPSTVIATFPDDRTSMDVKDAKCLFHMWTDSWDVAAVDTDDFLQQMRDLHQQFGKQSMTDTVIELVARAHKEWVDAPSR